MVDLLLCEPTWSDHGDCNATENRINILRKLESIIWSLITCEGRSEARLWLCKTISCFSSITPQAQCEVFEKLLRSRPRKTGLAAQLLQMIFEKRPHKLCHIIAKNYYILETFFKGNPRRILQWFGTFAGVGESEHRKGARALSQFSFVNRDICWDELVWKGKHGYSPAVVATKPHYFLDLDVQRTMENFIENVPEFWSSDELMESVKDGEIFLMDSKFFIDCFIELMYDKDSKEIWEVIDNFLLLESFSSLCNHLLLILEESDLSTFLKLLGKFQTLRMETESIGHPSYWLEFLLCIHNDIASIDELLLLNAVINQGRQLLRLLRDEEHEEERRKIGELVLEINNTSGAYDAALVKECLKTKKVDSVKWLGFLSWVLQFRLLEECKTPDSWEALFIMNKINFRKSSSYDLIQTGQVLEESESSFDDGGYTKARRKNEKTRKRRRRHYGLDDDDRDDLVDVDISSSWQNVQPREGSWLLSTDNYSSSWTSVDLPEYMAKYCFSTWMKWLRSK
ncbi:hypothetical protein FRX31_026075 [Thalictrum thalictroides]|uniref:Uncharacterized protein n=1 Tax=Thalictrum thalictroides TaxID=46969 RepID=A0A7J6VHU6_THATH|nr:hypothetical protein FRX31_026075 [Thalictrum thalictroides]